MESDDEDLQTALRLSREEMLNQPAPLTTPQQDQLPAVQVLGGFKARFRCYAAAAAGRRDLDATGKVLLSQSCLAALVSTLGGMPATLLLRLSHGGKSLFVGVAEFTDDKTSADMLRSVLGTGGRAEEVPRLHAGGPLAVVFVPRWVRASLLLEPACPEVSIGAVSLPRAAYLKLQPATSAFASALGQEADPRATLTELMNRRPQPHNASQLSNHP
jgi:hypothetical protein